MEDVPPTSGNLTADTICEYTKVENALRTLVHKKSQEALAKQHIWLIKLQQLFDIHYVVTCIPHFEVLQDPLFSIETRSLIFPW